MYEISFENGTVISGAGTRKQDVLVEGEKIIKVGKELSQPDAKVVDVSGSFFSRDLLTDIPILTWRLLVL